MLILGNMLIGLAAVLGAVLTIYFWILLIAVLIGWVNPDPYNPIVRFLRAATEPLLGWLRRKMPFLRAGALDLSPLVVFLIIIFLRAALVDSLHEEGRLIKDQALLKKKIPIIDLFGD